MQSSWSNRQTLRLDSLFKELRQGCGKDGLIGGLLKAVERLPIEAFS